MGVRKAERIMGKRSEESAPPSSAGFWLTLTDGSNVRCERLLLATGGNRSSAGFMMAEALGHAIEPLVPSLFTFHIDDARLIGLSGVSVENVIASVADAKLRETGPLLITHWGLSGPAILKLSAWGARELASRNYEFPLTANFAPPHTRESLVRELAQVREKNPRKQITTWSPLAMPQRLWERLVTASGIPATTAWTGVGNAALATLATQLTAAEFKVVGKSLFKDEFVTCGGVRLSEVDFRAMESRVCPGLHFAGEVLDIDGVTGGFNFQAAWTTGWLAGNAMAGG
jgi:predicted Rossmann fold flavoprotein